MALLSAPILLSILVAVPAAATPDPSKIVATCSVSDGTGPFSPTDTVTLVEGALLVFSLTYNNNDTGADPSYTAHFTATLLSSAAFGPTQVIDTANQFGGGGASTGTVHQVRVGPPATGIELQGIAVRITSDVTGSTILGRCNFLLRQIPVNDDLDGDGITNTMEMQGLRDTQGDLVLQGDGEPAADFPAMGANPCRKDLFVELDYQGTAPNGHDHRPGQAAIDQVAQAFADAPLPAPPGGCPFAGYSSGSGVHLRVEIDDVLPPEPLDANGAPRQLTCSDIDYAAFDPARRPYFVYGVFVHVLTNFASGLAPCPNRTLMVATGAPVNDYYTRVQAGAFMHELGHVLGLGHGGDSGVNLKPNYLSVMNYSFQTGIPDGSSLGRLDYSRKKLPTLHETALDESAGIGGMPGDQTFWWGPPPGFYYRQRSTAPAYAGPTDALDWNQNGHLDPGTVNVDINSDGNCIGPGNNSLRNTEPAGDDLVVSNQIRNGANHVCDTRPSGDDVLGPTPADGCITPGPNGVLDTSPVSDDVRIDSYIGLGPNLICDSSATGDDVQFADVGSGEPVLTGFDDWDAIDWRLGPSRAAPAPGAPLPPVEGHTDLTVAQLQELAIAGQPHAPIVTGQPDRAPNANGWYAAPVTIDWRVSGDAGQASDPPDTVAAIEGGIIYTSSPSCDPLNNCASGYLSLSIDLSYPMVTCNPTSFSLNQPGAKVTATVQDSVSGPAASTVSASVSTSTVGTRSVTLAGTDLAGRTTTVSCPYHVGYVFSGFLPPIDGPPVVNKAIAGLLPVPATWRLTDYNGVGIRDPRSFVSLTSSSISCSPSAPTDGLEIYGLLPGLHYLGNGYWTYGWFTPRSYRGTCRELQLNLSDGVGSRVARFRFI